jgi:hypothetical protein
MENEPWLRHVYRAQRDGIVSLIQHWTVLGALAVVSYLLLRNAMEIHGYGQRSIVGIASDGLFFVACLYFGMVASCLYRLLSLACAERIRRSRAKGLDT